VIRLHLGAICVSGSGLRHTGAHICGNANTCLTYEGVESQNETKRIRKPNNPSHRQLDFHTRGPRSCLYESGGRRERERESISTWNLCLRFPGCIFIYLYVRERVCVCVCVCAFANGAFKCVRVCVFQPNSQSCSVLLYRWCLILSSYLFILIY